MSNKTALITGASRGIGKGLALGLASLGYSTAIIGRKEETLAAVAEEIQSTHSTKCIPLVADVSNQEEIDQLATNAMSELGRIDILVNNAGIGRPGSLDEELEHFDKTLAINLRGPFMLMQKVLPIMKEQGSGYVFNIASRSGKIGFPSWGTYAASKFGLVGLSESLYREFAKDGIKFTTICPGWVDTDMASVSTLPAEDMVQVEDLAETLKFLLRLSPSASIREILVEPTKAIV